MGGQPSVECGWPTAVGFDGCSGTLVHPRVVLYAAHCGSNWAEIQVGEVYGTGGRLVKTERCEVFPGGGISENDYAYCVLEDPIEDIPIVPPLMGKDIELLTPDQLVWAVGFGIHDNDTGEYGTKYEVELPITGFEGPDDMFIAAGKDGKDGCSGDSGGPLYIELPEGRGWRVFGIASYGPFPCGPGGGWAQMHLAMEWFETQSGFDLTPCHDAQGNLDPDERCQTAPLDPKTGGGAWADSSCNWGDVFTPMDDEAPSIQLVMPTSGTRFVAGESISIQVEASDNEAIAVVDLYVNGEKFDSLYEAPFTWERSDLPVGDLELVTVARDMAANRSESETVQIVVESDSATTGGDTSNTDSDSDTSDTSSSSSDTSSSDSDSTATTDNSSSSTDSDDNSGTSSDTTSTDDTLPGGPMLSDPVDDEGCGCISRGRKTPLFAIFAGFALLAFRRRTLVKQR